MLGRSARLSFLVLFAAALQEAQLQVVLLLRGQSAADYVRIRCHNQTLQATSLEALTVVVHPIVYLLTKAPVHVHDSPPTLSIAPTG